MPKTLVGMLLPRSAQLEFANELWRATYTFAPLQATVPLVRGHDRNVVGQVRYLEQGVDGEAYIAALVPDSFRLDEQRYLSLTIAADSKAKMSPRRVAFDGCQLVEVELVEHAESWNNSPAQVTPRSFIDTTGGYAKDLGDYHRQVLNRAHVWTNGHSRSDHHVLLADPLKVLAIVQRRQHRRDEIVADAVAWKAAANKARAEATIDQAIADVKAKRRFTADRAAAVATVKRRSNEVDTSIPAELATTGRVLHRRTYDHGQLVAASAVVR